MQELLKRYLEGRVTPEEKKLVDEWYDSLSRQRDGIRIHDDEKRTLREFYWNSLASKMGHSSGRIRSLLPGFIGIAAAVAGIAILSVIYFESPDLQPLGKKETAVLYEVNNDSESVRSVSLPDSSEVVLFPGSKLEYGSGFNLNERKIHLTGEAFFDISHNEQKPFYVYTSEVVTKVLGTSFSVKAYPGDRLITVSVKSGKVSVYTQVEKDILSENLILTPNQEAVYTRSDQKVSRKLVEEPQIIIPEEEVKKIRFEGASLADIFRALEKMYGVEIIFDAGVFSDCSITTWVDGQNLYERIDVICDITGSKYEIDGTRILISGTGCN